jgi:hypothetical protein
MLRLLQKYKLIVAEKIRRLHGINSVINTFIEQLIECVCATESDIFITEMSERHIALGQKNDFSDSVGFYREFTCFCRSRYTSRINLSYPVGGYFESIDSFLSEPSQPTRFFSIDPKGRERKEAGLYLVGYTRGYYGVTNDLPQRIMEYAYKNGFIFTGPVYNIYLSDELSETDPSQYLLQFSAPVAETG